MLERDLLVREGTRSEFAEEGDCRRGERRRRTAWLRLTWMEESRRKMFGGTSEESV